MPIKKILKPLEQYVWEIWIDVTGLKPWVGKTARSALEKDMAHKKDHKMKQSRLKKS